jgi:hypothetical protein
MRRSARLSSRFPLVSRRQREDRNVGMLDLATERLLENIDASVNLGDADLQFQKSSGAELIQDVNS